jgi:hypothetical protein
MQHRGFIQEEYAQQACLLSIYVGIPTPQSSDLQFPDLLHPVPPTFCFFFTPQTLLQSSAAATHRNLQQSKIQGIKKHTDPNNKLLSSCPQTRPQQQLRKLGVNG